MPVIIDEVIISVEVTNQASGGRVSTPSTLDDKQIIIAECVERVLEILQQKGER
ncbi:MAG TPA: hypothetical protein HPP94_02700 [Desulfuromonadales bacterium]|nr:hypothetical protein [Desulfuromonadales bacterium]